MRTANDTRVGAPLAGALATAILVAACANGDESSDTVATKLKGDAVASARFGSDPALAEAIDAYLEPLIAQRDFSGVVLVGTDDAVRYLRAFGRADDANGVANDPDTRFAIASLTKTFTAGATLIAEERGLLGLDDSLESYGLDFPRAADITVRHLLLHASGLANVDYREALDATIELDELVARIVRQPLLFEPGSQHRYSNAGFNVLAYVLERASGRPYEDYLREAIFEPLGMEATGHPRTSATGIATGYLPAPPPAWRQPSPRLDPGFMVGSGSLTSNARDLLRWARAVGRERLFTWREREWPYGWGRERIGAHEGIEQTGGTPGFMSNLLVFPDDGLYVVVLLNQEFGGWVPTGRGLAAIAFGEDRDPPARRRPVALEPDALDRYVGRYADADGTLRVVARDGHLWLYSGDWPIGKYLTPLGDATFTPRSDVGRILFGDLSADRYRTMRWDFGESARTYTRP